MKHQLTHINISLLASLLLLVSCNGELLEELNDEQTAGNFCPTTRLANGNCPSEATGASSWLFNNSNNYTFNSNYVEISASKATLKTVDQLFAGSDFNSGTHVGTYVSGGNITLQRSSLNFHNSTWSPQYAQIVHYWRLDNDLSDSIGSSNGTFSVKDAFDSDSKVGSHSIDLDGSVDRVILSADTADFTDNFTISAWFKTSDSTKDKRVFCKRGTTTQYDIYIDSSGRIRMHDGTSTHGGANPNAFNDGVWHHLTVVFNGNTSRFYVDGVQEGANFNPSITDTNEIAVIGALNNGAGPMLGSIDEVVVWNSPLMSSEVLTIYNQQKSQYAGDTSLSSDWTPHWDNIVGYWKMDGNWQDSSGNGNHGTAGGNATFNSSGKVGNHAGDFPAVSNVSFGNSSDFDFTTQVSFSQWLKLRSYESGYAIHPLTKYSNTANTPFQFYLFGSIDSSLNPCASCMGDIRIFGTAGGSWQSISGKYEDLELNRWIHVAFSYDSTTGGQLYINGVPHGAKDGGGALASNTSSLRMIHNPTSYDGSLVVDDTAVWDVALSDADIKLIYNRQKQKYAGHYDSPIIDLGTSGSWTNLNAVTSLPFGKEIVAGVSESSSDYSDLSGDANNQLNGYWSFNAGTGSTVFDQVNTNNGAWQGTLTSNWHLGLFGHAGQLNGTDNYLDFGDPTIFNSAPLTVSVWVNTNDSSFSPIVFKGSLPPNSPRGWALVYDGGKVQWRVADASYTWHITESSNNYNDGIWHHIVGTIAPSGMKLFVDGREVATDHQSSFNYSSGRNLKVGAHSSSFYSGSIDELAIWNRTLTDTEIEQLYRRGANRVKYQVKSCVDAACNCKSYSTTPAGSTTDCDGDGTLNAADSSDIHAAEFIGPGGNGATSYSELFNRAPGDLTFNCTNNTTDSDNTICVDDEITLAGDARTTSPSFTFSDMATSAAPTNNRYFQYRVMMEAEDNTACSGSACLPELTSVGIGPTGRYYGGSPVVASKNPIAYSDLSSMTFSEAGSCSLTYQLSPDGSTYYYHNGSAWVSAGSESVALSSNAATTAANIESFVDTVGAGSLYFKAFMTSDTSQSCSLDEIEIKIN